LRIAGESLEGGFVAGLKGAYDFSLPRLVMLAGDDEFHTLGAERAPCGANWIELPAVVAIVVTRIYCAAWLRHG
jgi:hypothetical protein